LNDLCHSGARASANPESRESRKHEGKVAGFRIRREARRPGMTGSEFRRESQATAENKMQDCNNA
jgi:hypothetical protein